MHKTTDFTDAAERAWTAVREYRAAVTLYRGAVWRAKIDVFDALEERAGDLFTEAEKALDGLHTAAEEGDSDAAGAAAIAAYALDEIFWDTRETHISVRENN